ncbi:MAG: VWA domain-containing protein [Chloroflexota bacterium]|nr:MAG: VWA domain-containing protein [Chloroflexota bacterium]
MIDAASRGQARSDDEIVGGRLVRNILLFGRVLRAAGIPLSAGREMELLGALRLVNVGDRDQVYAAAASILLSHRDHRAIFDRAFALFFALAFRDEMSPPPDAPRSTVDEAVGQAPPEDGSTDADVEAATANPMARPSDTLNESQEKEADGAEAPDAQTYSGNEVLRAKDFDRYTSEEIARARELMRQMRLRPGVRRTRRMVPSAGGRHLDMRAVTRGMHRTVGEPLHLYFREKKLKKRKLVLLCDISGSMERYSRVLLQFLHAARQGMSNVEVFVFGTRLTRVTRDLASRQVDAALDHIATRVQDFAGGTRIGRSFHDFNRLWGRRVMGQSAVCIIISDGWDRGDPKLLRQEMERLQRGAFRLIWLNPLLGLPEYQPVTLGMRTALEFVDDFMPAHNLASLEALAERLATLEERRPVRRHASTLAT